MKLPKSKLGLENKPPFYFWVIFLIIILLSGIAIWKKWGFDYKITDIRFSANRNYCQQDSDCVLVPKYQSCCPQGCGIEAVNVETKNRELETRNKTCSTKKYNCPDIKYCKPHDNEAVCEQNRCVVKEKPINGNQLNLKNYKIIGSFTSPGESSFVKVLGPTAGSVSGWIIGKFIVSK